MISNEGRKYWTTPQVPMAPTVHYTHSIAYLPSHYITVTQFQYILIISIARIFAGYLRQTKEAMLTYIYLNVDECWLTSSMRQQRFKLQISFHYANIEQNTFSWGVVDGHVSFNLVGVHITLVLPYHVYSINNDRRIACMLDWIKTI